MADNTEGWEYLVAPLSGQWRTQGEARVLLDAWLSQEGRTGAPSITVSRRPVKGAAVSPTAVYLASPCGTCGHTLNWHLNGHLNNVGCRLPRCACSRFVPVD